MSFTTSLAKFESSTKDRLNRTKRVVVIKLFSAIIMDTPVLTGRLRGNWQTSIGSPVLATVDRTDLTGAQAIAEVERTAALMKSDDAAYLTNNLPYVEVIEYEGWSKKAPEGMVRRNVERFRRLISEAIRDGRL